MGTYVGSCLGLGGRLTYSAAAVVLDINKQVLYARDLNNKVIARQLIAVSENDELVCFEIYPTNSKSQIKKMFAEYDKLFADKLNIILHDGLSSEYTIANIISYDWWDDFAWDLNAKE